MTDKRLGAYVGIDPTAPSLHVGHLLPLMSLFWLYIHGYHAVTLLGGATSKIGDPTDRLTTRVNDHSSVRTKNMVSMHYQLKKLWANVERSSAKYGYKWEWAWKRGLVNNNAWMNKLTIMELLQSLGPGLRMGSMMAKDTVKNKMEKGDGMSFAEFTYPVLQAWDWWHMYLTKGIHMQIGGSDQYGNITAGIDAVKYLAANEVAKGINSGLSPDSPPPLGFTVPLLTTSSGQKFGKSAGNAIWLDKDMTTSFDLFNYFMRQSDNDVGRFLKLFTFMPLEAIDELMEEHNKAPKERKAQRKLAFEFVELVHGVEDAQAAEFQHSLMYSKNVSIPSPSTAPATKDKEIPIGPLSAKDARNKAEGAFTSNASLLSAPLSNVKLPRSFIFNMPIARIVHATGLSESSTVAHRLIGNGSIYIGGKPSQKKAMNDASLDFTPVKLWAKEDTAKFMIHDNLLIFRRGKNNVRIVEVMDDDEWKASGLTFPGHGAWSGAKGSATEQETKADN